LYYRNDPEMHDKMASLLAELHREFGWKSRLASLLGGRYLLRKIRREEERLAAGWTYEPPTFYEHRAEWVEATAEGAAEATADPATRARTSRPPAASERVGGEGPQAEVPAAARAVR
jgi:aryl-alcohol dehydrogenase-like predicted oxidoreductase